MKEAITKEHLPKLESYLRNVISLKDVAYRMNFLARGNYWYPMTNKWHSLWHMCTGMDTLEPNYRFERNRMVWSFELNKNSHRMGMFCESPPQMQYTDPRLNII